MKKCHLISVAAILTSLFLYGCGGPPPPLDEIRSALKGVPTYSVILDDMKEEGSFFNTYYHKYRIIMEDKATETGWQEAPKDYYRRNMPFLGMTIWVKKEGKGAEAVGPAGYEYVGDRRYGRWQTNSSGQSFWAFYGQYMFMSALLGRGPIYRDHYTTYTTSRSQNRPYYGPHNEYGTNGSLTKRQKPNFYARRMSRARAKQASFSNRVNQRTGRTRTSARGRSGSWGK